MVDFSLTDEQRLLKDSVDRFVQAEYPTDTRRALSDSELGFSRDNWAKFAELGWLALPFAESDGGLDGGPTELMVLMEAFGRGLVLEPYLATIVLGGGILHRAGSDEQKAKLIPPVIAGEHLLAFAYAEPQGRFTLNDVSMAAQADGDGYVLNGHKSVVFHGAEADTLIVSARTAGHRRDVDGVSLFLVDADAAGLTRRGYATLDGLRAADIKLENVRVGADALVGTKNHALAVIDEVIDHATVAVCAEAMGAMDVLHELTLEYLKTREQFGVPIGKFQVLQHRSVDMFVACQEARSMVYMATCKLDEPVAERHKAVSAAKTRCGQSGRLVSQEAVQLHGGMGVTDELSVGLYFKRVTMIESTFGNVDHHLDRFATLSVT